MMKNCIFHEPVIPCDTLQYLALCLTSNVFTKLYISRWVVSFNRSGKILYFPKNVTFFLFWMAVYSLAV